MQSCIQDDFIQDAVDPELRISSQVDTIEINTTFQFEVIFLNNVGTQQQISPTWTSSNEDIITIDSDGVAFAVGAGSSTITVEYMDEGTLLTDSQEVVVGMETVIVAQSFRGFIEPSSFYELTGDFEYVENGDDIDLIFSDNYRASAALPGLFIYLSNNRNSIASALEIGEVEVFSGAHSYTIENVGFSDFSYLVYFCKPFNVKVGDGSLK